ncbi:MAG TPA: sigma-70 family RNA polymerase sigma factor, partial [bacterium]|nr:sigma-70 family RNA polymerase sigma factor [bacterium]
MIETDEKLIERCAGGDTGALEELMGRYRDPLMAFMVGMIRDYHRAQEAYQDTFIRVFRGAPKFRAGKKFKTWLYAIAANRCRDELRSMKRKRTWSLDAPLTSEEEEGTTHGDLLEYPGPGPGDEAAAAEFREMLDRELRELSAAHREVVVLNRIN